jgi:hypothetical protein
MFRDATVDWGLDRLPILDNWKLAASSIEQNRFQLAVADFNRDGRLDVAITALGATRWPGCRGRHHVRLLRPAKNAVGDSVSVAEIQGIVREVGPVATVIETTDNGLTHRHTVPNAKMLSAAVRHDAATDLAC